MSSELELELESESVAMILVESVARLDGGLEVEPLVNSLLNEDFPDLDLPEVLPVEVLDEVVSSGSRLWHLEVT